MYFNCTLCGGKLFVKQTKLHEHMREVYVRALKNDRVETNASLGTELFTSSVQRSVRWTSIRIYYILTVCPVLTIVRLLFNIHDKRRVVYFTN